MTSEPKTRSTGKTPVELLRILVAVGATLLTLYIYTQTRGDKIRTTLHDIDVRLATLSAGQFTTGDGQRVWEEFSSVRQEMALLPQEAPPLWFETRVNVMETRILEEIKANRERLVDLLGRVQRLEATSYDGQNEPRGLK
jgi:hypothetical protein